MRSADMAGTDERFSRALELVERFAMGAGATGSEDQRINAARHARILGEALIIAQRRFCLRHIFPVRDYGLRDCLVQRGVHACADAGQLLWLELPGGKIIRRIPVPGRPTGLALTPYATRLIVTCAAPKSTVLVLDATFPPLFLN